DALRLGELPFWRNYRIPQTFHMGNRTRPYLRGRTSFIKRGPTEPAGPLFLNVAAHHAALLQIALVVLLGLPEDRCRLYLGGDGQPVRSGGIQFRYFGPGLAHLFFASRKDDA